MMCIKMKTIIPDTSAVIEGAISKIIAEEDLDYPEIIVPEAVVCELEHQANANRNEGINDLKELQKLQEAQDNGELAITFKGKRPTNYDIKYAKSGEIDSLIRDLARSEFGTLVTNDKVQAETAKAQGISVYYFKQEYKHKELSIEKLFDDESWKKAEATLKAIWNQTKTDQLLFNPENTEFQWPNHHFQKLLK